MSMLVLSGDQQLQQTADSLLSDGKTGQKIFRKGLRAAMKVIAKEIKDTFPRKSGAAAMSAKVKAMKRKKGRIGVRVSVFALGKNRFPYPMGIEGGIKFQKPGTRVRKAIRTVTAGGVSQRRTDEAASGAYHKLAWRVKPTGAIAKAFARKQDAAQMAMLATCRAELDKVKP